jgi:hypothetical protein
MVRVWTDETELRDRGYNFVRGGLSLVASPGNKFDEDVVSSGRRMLGLSYTLDLYLAERAAADNEIKECLIIGYTIDGRYPIIDSVRITRRASNQ